jgi:hypothetical protein
MKSRLMNATRTRKKLAHPARKATKPALVIDRGGVASHADNQIVL